MKIKDIVDAVITHDSAPDFVEKTKECFNLPFTRPYFTKVKHLHSGTAGKHTGLYFIFQKLPDSYIYYYTGIATKGNTVNNRFQPHYAKLTVNLPAMYGALDRARRETRWQFPKNWRKGVKQHFLNNQDDIPDYWKGRQKHDIIEPANLDWKPDFKVDVNNLDCMVFELGTLTAKQIDDLETEFIRVFKPVFNGSKTSKI